MGSGSGRPRAQRVAAARLGDDDCASEEGFRALALALLVPDSERFLCLET